MKQSKKRSRWIGKARRALATSVLGIGGLILGPLTASAAVIIDIDTYVTGSVANPGTATVARLTLAQNGANVDFKFENLVNNLPSMLGDDAFISELEFSYDGNPPLTAASFTNFGGTQLISQSSISINPPGSNAGYNFFLSTDYPTSNNPNANPNRFVNGEISTWTITGVSESDFLNLVTGSGASSLALVHIQQVGAGQGGAASVKYVGDSTTPPTNVPEPGTVALLGLGLLGFAAARQRRQKQV